MRERELALWCACAIATLLKMTDGFRGSFYNPGKVQSNDWMLKH